MWTTKFLLILSTTAATPHCSTTKGGVPALGYGSCEPFAVCVSPGKAPCELFEDRTYSHCNCDQMVYKAMVNKSTVVAGTLDNVVIRPDLEARIRVTVHDPASTSSWTLSQTGGDSEAARADVLARHKQRAKDLVYDTTDHALVEFAFRFYGWQSEERRVLVVSLDNSERANKHGKPAFERVPRLCRRVREAIDGRPTVVVFLEAGRRSFEGRRPVLWPEFMAELEYWCQLTHQHTVRNNDGDLAFGIAVFDTAANWRGTGVAIIRTEALLKSDDNFGSVAVGLHYRERQCGGRNPIVWVVGLPFDMTGTTTTRATEKALDLFRHANTIAVLGDFNTVAGPLASAFLTAVANRNLTALVPLTLPTFFGAHFDAVQL
jgi:hypothetical protein